MKKKIENLHMSFEKTLLFSFCICLEKYIFAELKAFDKLHEKYKLKEHGWSKF